MERKAIAISGISTGSNYEDGACVDMMNMRHEQGVLKPVESFPVDYTLKHVYELLYWHKNNDYDNLIGVRSGVIYWIKNEGQTTESETLLITVTDSVVFSHIGNIINVLDGKMLKYLFYQGGKYQLIDLSFKDGDDKLVDLKVDGKIEKRSGTIHTNDVDAREIRTFCSESTYGYNTMEGADSVDARKARCEAYMGLLKKGIKTVENDGYLVGCFMACIVIEMYDGSHFLISNPILLGQAYDSKTRYALSIYGYNTDYMNTNAIFTPLHCNTRDWSDEEYSLAIEVLRPELDIYGSFIGYFIGDYCLKKDSFLEENSAVFSDILPNLIGSYQKRYISSTSQKIVNKDVRCSISYNELKFKINSNISEELRPIIKGINVYISQETIQYKISDTDIAKWLGQAVYTYSENDFISIENMLPPIKSDKELIDKLKTNQQFYKVIEIPFNDIKTTTENDGWVTIDLKGKLGDNLLVQEQLNLNAFSNIQPTNQMTYNSMLHAWDVKDILSKGYPMNFYYAQQGIGQFESISQTSAIEKSYCKVKLKTDTGISEIVRSLTKNNWTSLSLNPMLVFPDRRATEITLYKEAGMSLHEAQQAMRLNIFPATDIPDYSKSFYCGTTFFSDGIYNVVISPDTQNQIKVGDKLTSSKQQQGGLELIDDNMEIYITYINQERSIIQFTSNIYPGHTLIGSGYTFEISGYTSRPRSVLLTATKTVTIPVMCIVQFVCSTTGDDITLTKNATLPANSSSEVISYNADHDFDSIIRIKSCAITGFITQNDDVDTYFDYFGDGGSNGYILSDRTTTKYNSGTAYKQVFQLTPSDTQNFSYYIAPDLKPINLASGIAEIVFPVSSDSEIVRNNVLKVSNVNNPFIFPDKQTYQLGDGTILNVASQSIRTSDGQFGQYPLICFCTDGLFSLQVGDGTVAYSRIGNPQNYERPISKVICVTPFGIAFISNRGLCMVAGQDIVYLSESMFEKFRNITLELPDQISELFALDLSLFNDYLKACTAMIYNPKEQEIIMINHAKTYNYVYNMSTKQFYRNDEAITNEIANSLPDMQVWNGMTVKKVTITEAGARKIAFVTRPIKMQTPDMKRFERVILRSYLSGATGTPATACVWGSLDDRNFKLLRGMVLENGITRKDIDFGMFGKTTYRSYIIGLSMNVGSDSEIEAVEMQVEKEFVNSKMR